MRTLHVYGAVIGTLFVLSTVLLFYTRPDGPQVDFFQYMYSPTESQEDDSIGIFENKLKRLYNGVKTFVLFIGYGRSGHSLVGAILDAHPNIIISQEFNVLPNWDYYKNMTNVRNRLFFDLHARSRKQAMFGNRAASHKSVSGYSYHVVGQWQGTYQEKIQVIGDKKGSVTSSFLLQQGFQILDKMEKALQMPLKFIHVIRNPFDNIATIVLRKLDVRMSARDGSFKVNNSRVLDDCIVSHFKHVESVQRLHQHGKYEILDICSHEIIAHPQENLKKLCSFLQVACGSDYIDAVSNLLYSTPSKTRHSILWTSEQKARVTELMKKYPFMWPFSFDSN